MPRLSTIPKAPLTSSQAKRTPTRKALSAARAENPLAMVSPTGLSRLLEMEPRHLFEIQ